MKKEKKAKNISFPDQKNENKTGQTNRLPPSVLTGLTSLLTNILWAVQCLNSKVRL